MIPDRDIVALLNTDKAHRITSNVFEVESCYLSIALAGPVNYIIKRCRHLYEATVLRMVNEMNIPSPKLVYTFTYENTCYIIMEKVEGDTLENVVDPNTLEILYNQLREVLTCMRQKTSTEIVGIDGHVCTDPLITSYGERKYTTEIAFNESLHFLLKKRLPDLFALMIVRGLGHEHRFVFTHADLTPRNIIVRNGKLEAIIDWEFAGFYPEYWEYAKALYTVSLGSHWAVHIDNIMPQVYYHEAALMMVVRQNVPVLWMNW